MKKLALTIAIVLGLSMTSFGAWGTGGGLFQRGPVTDEEYYGAANYRDGGLIMPGLPNHGLDTNQNAPLGSGIVLLASLGAAYLVAKRRKED